MTVMTNIAVEVLKGASEEAGTANNTPDETTHLPHLGQGGHVPAPKTERIRTVTG